jgi:exodeoxyribonuclease VIII
MNGKITSRMPALEYHVLPGINITSLKEMKRSPKHYQYRLLNPRSADKLTLGTAAHVATLEPERFAGQFAIWTRRSEAGNLCPRKGQYWDAFVRENAGKTLITEGDLEKALAMAKAVRDDPLAARYLETGEPEVSMQWRLTSESLLRKPVEIECRGRVDWLTRIDGEHHLIGLKTSTDCRPFIFGSQAARLGYHLQWAFYLDGYKAITGVTPTVKEIVVESAPPYDVVVNHITEDVLMQGRSEYEVLLRQWVDCHARKEWLGVAGGVEQIITLPTWTFDAQDDIADLELETET